MINPIIMDATVSDKTSLRRNYHNYILRKVLFIVILVACLFICTGISLTLGSRNIGFFEAYGVLWDHIAGMEYATGTDEWWDDYIVWDVRLPRILVAVVVGGALAVCGAVIQSIVKNPLADPYTTGISSGAIFGVAVAIALGFVVVQGQGGNSGTVLNAFVFGLIPALVIIVISRYRNSTSATIILAGIAMSYMFSALCTLIMLTSSAEDLQSIYLWQIGSLENTTWGTVTVVGATTAVGAVLCMLLSNKLNVLSAGDSTAKSLGLDTEGLKTLCLLVISFMTASVVSYVGVIGFLGIVAPNIARIVLGSDNRYIIPASMAIGAAFLVFTDTISRLSLDVSMPVGVVMSMIGGPVFLLIILFSKKGV